MQASTEFCLIYFLFEINFIAGSINYENGATARDALESQVHLVT